MPYILIVCTANVCRSPVAEALLRDRLHRSGREQWKVGSAGTWAHPGQHAAEFSTQLMGEQGLDIENHSSRIVTDTLLTTTDLVLCMEIGHAEALRAEFPHEQHKIYLLSDMSDRHYSVKDPYGGPLEAYQSMVAEVAGLIDEGMPRIIETASENEGLRSRRE
jgi:protein-tyrosine-phosphatase